MYGAEEPSGVCRKEAGKPQQITIVAVNYLWILTCEKTTQTKDHNFFMNDGHVPKTISL